MSATVSVGAFVGDVRNGKAFRVTVSGGDSRGFGGFECAIHALAATCEYCGVEVIGHGVGAGGHCAPKGSAEGAVEASIILQGLAPHER